MKEELEAKIKEHLPERRIKHTEGVVAEAVALCRRYGSDPEKAAIAALFHDLCRVSQEESDCLVEELGIDSRYLGNRNLAHGKLAAVLAQKEYGIEDRDILNAIAFHTTGRAGMSLLEKTVYLADVIEPGRDYPGVDELRRLAYEDLNKACLFALESSIRFVKEKAEVIDEDTLRARDFLKGEFMENREIAQKAAIVLDGKKAVDPVIIDVSRKSSFADYLVLASGNSDRQVGSLASELEDQFAKDGILAKSIEGKKESGWILMDFGDIVVNVFSNEQRQRYNLEKVWGDCPFIEIEAEATKQEE